MGPFTNPLYSIVLILFSSKKRLNNQDGIQFSKLTVVHSSKTSKMFQRTKEKNTIKLTF